MVKKCSYFLFLMLIVSSCTDYLEVSMKVAEKNSCELKSVLEHFKNDSNPLKYEAAKFLIENMPYHKAYNGDNMQMLEQAYITMAKSPREFRDSVFKAETNALGTKKFRKISDVKRIKADFLIKTINDACDIWARVNWNKDYDESLFFNYVLPYRLFEEPFSDWHTTINEEFPYLDAMVVYSKKGIQIPAFSEQIMNAELRDLPSSLKGKAVQMEKEGACVTFTIDSPIATQKLVNFRYNTTARDTKAMVMLNGEIIDTLHLEPVNSIYAFRNSDFGKVMSFSKGENKLTVKFVDKTFCLDYIELAAFELYNEGKCEDYSNFYCQIQNVGTRHFVSLDTLKATMEKPVTLRKYSSNDRTLNLRLDYMGYPCWRIMPMDTINMCMEDRWVSLNPMAAVGKYSAFESNGGSEHQKWVIIPIGGGLCKIMNKFSGMFWESSIDEQTGKEIIVQNVYSGKATQKWKITKKGRNPFAHTFFKIGNAQSQALRVTDAMEQFEHSPNRGGMAPRLSLLCKYKTGICQDEASYTMSLSRHLGIPTAIDFTPNWGNRPNGHTWSVFILPNGKGTPFYMGCAPGDTTQYAHNYIKPKIFRRRYAVNRDFLDDLSGEKSVPELFKYPKFTDVTDEYYETTDVKRDIPEKYRNHDVAYICVNDKHNWVPVHYGKIFWGTATFKSMGRNILYTIGVWENNKIVPIGNPFIVQNDGSVREVSYSYKKRQTMTLNRKYPFFGRFDKFNIRMAFGRFHGSNKADFSDRTTLYVHEGITEGCWYERKLKPSTQTYKYLRYYSPAGSFGNVNEIEFYNSKGQKLIGKIIGTQGIEKQTKETVFDGDVLTGFNGNSPDGHWVGLELPQPSEVGMIRYMPRNDGNCVEIGDKYQLMMYIDGKWKTLAWIRAKDTKLVFKNMPSGGLYLLRDRTKGKDERIFTYENDKQVWW